MPDILRKVAIKSSSLDEIRLDGWEPRGHVRGAARPLVGSVWPSAATVG